MQIHPVEWDYDYERDILSCITHTIWHFNSEEVDGPNFSGRAYGPTNYITLSIKMLRHLKSLYLTAISTEMAIIHAVRDTFCNRVRDLLFKVNGIIFQSVRLRHVYKQGFAEGENFFAIYISTFRKCG